jgi:triosephosphate isomerase (TIM)
MRKKVIAANWKMNLTYAEAMTLTDALVDATDVQLNSNIILAAPFVFLHDLIGRIQSHPLFSVGAQNCSAEEKGAFTGEVSASMLASIGVEHVIIGHSERRAIFKEDDSLVARKISKALEHGLIPVFCCGENLEQRKEKKHFEIVERQLNQGLFHIADSSITECIIAYEPVWAIGTGINAKPGEAQEMHAFIREIIRKKFGEANSGNISIVYGGSVTSKNASELFDCQDVDGGLVGGASLKAPEFLSIIQSMQNIPVK